ncbi:hypothetical protein [Bifidobacterium aquikefiri]|uniref:hypothetical protein n=1 Tax=Bifidobacterium aquikefiri TaxID=1653207 RepID=UPI0023F577DA|nr:hypothetical protein [Bifidobacterium aquikefiri]
MNQFTEEQHRLIINAENEVRQYWRRNKNLEDLKKETYKILSRQGIILEDGDLEDYVSAATEFGVGDLSRCIAVINRRYPEFTE